MPRQTIKIRRGTKAELTALGLLSQGEMGFCTDTKEVFIGDGIQNVFVGKVLQGAYINRPNAGIQGRFFYVTEGANIGYLYIDNGSTWNRINSLTLTDLTGTIDDLKDGATYAKVKKTDVTNGQVNKISDGTKSATASELRDHMSDSVKHRIINDNAVGNTDLWSAQKIKNELELAKQGMEYQDSVKDKDLSTPPVTSTTGDRYIVKTPGSGIWLGRDNQITEWNGTTWTFNVPKIGTTLFVDDESKQYTWNGTAWVISGAGLQTVVAGNGLTGGGQADTVTLNIGAGNGVTVNADTITVKAYKGIAVDSNGVATDIDGISIIYDSTNGNKLTVASIDGGTF